MEIKLRSLGVAIALPISIKNEAKKLHSILSFPHGKVVKKTQILQAGIYSNILIEVLLGFCNGFPLDSARCSLFLCAGGNDNKLLMW